MTDEEITSEAVRVAGAFFGKYHARLARVHVDKKELTSEAYISISTALAEGKSVALGKIAWQGLRKIMRREEGRLSLNDSCAPATAAGVEPLDSIDWSGDYSPLRIDRHRFRGPSCNPSPESQQFMEHIADVRASAIIQNSKNDSRKIEYETKAKESRDRIAGAQLSEGKSPLAGVLLDRSKLNAALSDAKACLSPANVDAVNSLPYRKQIVLLLCGLLGLKQVEVAKIIGVSSRTVGNDLRTAEIDFARYLQFGAIFYNHRDSRPELARWAA
jgi:hypothetical protein